jgi:membrane associated rhomboid family serine protease
MLEDRSYMRRTPFRARPSATVMLLGANVAAFVLLYALYQWSSFPTNDYLALSLGGLERGYVWQLLTYQFMHVGVLHLLFNCWAIYVFGSEVEGALGRKSFLTLYFSSGVIGGVAQALAGLLLGGAFAAPVVGASAAAFGLAAAFALLFPDRLLWLFFVLPLRAKWILPLSAGLAVFGILSRGDHVAHAAHLGGILTGVFFVRSAVHWEWRWGWRWPRLSRARRQPARRLVRVSSEKPAAWARSRRAAPEDLPPEEYLSQEVDPILDKISAQGIQSLTERERRILETARAKMGKR